MKCQYCNSEEEMLFEDDTICASCFTPKRNKRFLLIALPPFIVAILVALALITQTSCTKPSKCYTCAQDVYSYAHEQYFTSKDMVDFCGTEKEYKAFVEGKKSQKIIVRCN